MLSTDVRRPSIFVRKPPSSFSIRPPAKESLTLNQLKSIARQNRNAPSKDIFEPALTDREWWRVTLKETPVPGTYESRHFLDEKELNPIKRTYNFKGQGRKKQYGVVKNGANLLPGAYNYKDFLESLSERPLTYEFKSDGRSRVLPGIKDKDCNVPPCEYARTKSLVPKTPVHHSNFKSQSARFPTKYFNPKIGPPPGSYDPRNLENTHPVSSCFKSRSPRFKSSQTKVPGPATYEPTFQNPQSKTLMKMGRMHGLFFRNTFEF